MVLVLNGGLSDINSLFVLDSPRIKLSAFNQGKTLQPSLMVEIRLGPYPLTLD